MNRNQYYFLIAIAAVSLFGIYLRVQDIVSRGLEYDEIWTWSNYTVKSISVIFSDLTFPNNHPLHSLATKLSIGLFGKSYFALRLPALLAGLCIPPLAGFMAWRLTRNKIAILIVFSICAFNGGLIYYSQVARGYSMLILFVLIAGISLFAMRDAKAERKTAPVIFLLSAAAAVLTISSGIVFIIALFLIWFLYAAVEWRSPGKWFKGEWPFILSFSIFCFICLFWYGRHYEELRSSREYFGEDVRSPLVFLSFAWRMLWNISGILWIIIFISLFSKEDRWKLIFILLFLLLVTLSALVTKCGYEYSRTYLPLL